MPSPLGPLEGPALYMEIARRLSAAQREMLKGRISGRGPMRVHARTERTLRQFGLLSADARATELGRAVAGYLV
jgi:hypothetical protein